MAGLPPIKPPGDFTGKGIEIIGDPVKGHDEGTMRFKDGIFKSLSFPDFIDDAWAPETAEAWNRQWELDAVEDIAERIRTGEAELPELKPLLPARSRINDVARKRFLERAAKRVIDGGQRSDWPARNRRQNAAVVALMESAREGNGPPTMAAVVAKMKTLRDEKEFPLAAGDDNHLVGVICQLGFAWLERRPRGRQRER